MHRRHLNFFWEHFFSIALFQHFSYYFCLFSIARDVSACSHGSVKLWSAFSSTPSNEGIVLICKAGTWYPVLDSSNCRAAEIACNATGTNELKC